MHFVDAKHLLQPGNGMNIYRGCTHGCIYCDSRSTCYQMKHAFEDIEVKRNAPQLLEKELRQKRQRCMIGTGAMCDPYMHCEETLMLTRQCLQLIADHGFGLAVQTKSDRILRDIELLDRINRQSRCVVQMTLTTYDEALCAILEPDVCTTSRRYEALREMHACGIPTVVWMTPILPFINDTPENIRALVELCADAGVMGIIYFGAGTTIRDGDREYFFAALDRHFPGMKQRYLKRYGNAYECMSDRDPELTALFHQLCEQHRIIHSNRELFTYMHTYPSKEPACEQLSMFDLP